MSLPFTAPKNPAVGFVSRSTLKGWLWALSIGILGLWRFHIPQFASGFDKFPGDRGDARLVAFLMEHWHHVFQGTAHWRSPGMFYPVQGTLGYADLLLGYGIGHSLFRTLGFGIFEAAEATIILFNFLAYVACFVLLNKVLRFNLAASIAGAVFFAYNNPKLVQLGHTQLQPILFLPLAIIPIVIFVQKREKLSQSKAFALLALAALSLVLQLLTGFYAGWFFFFWSALFLLVALVFGETRKVIVTQVLKFWPAMLGGAMVFLIGLIPFFKAYLPVLQSTGGRDYEQVQRLIPVPFSFLVTSTRNYVWGSFSTAILDRRPEISLELHIGIGLVATVAWIALALFAVWLVVRYLRAKPLLPVDHQTNLLFLATLIIATSLVYLLGIRYWSGFSPWQFVFAWVPGGSVIRGVSRHVLVMALPIAIAFAWLIDRLSQAIRRQVRSTRRSLLLASMYAVIGFGLVEQFAHGRGFDGFSIKNENAYLNRVSHDLPNNCSSFYAAIKPTALHNIFEYQVDAALVSAIKRVPTLNGYSGQLPPKWDLWDMMGEGYENNVKRWIAERQLQGNVCRLFLRGTTAPDDIADSEVFIRQQYIDLLRRQPDGPGLQTWLTKLNTCTRRGGRGADQSCDRESVSMAILQSDEFSQRSYFVLRFYLAVLGRLPLLQEFLADRESLVTAEVSYLKTTQATLINKLVQGANFRARYDSLSNAAFVDQLLNTAGNTSATRSDLVNGLDSGQKTRADVVLAVMDDAVTIKTFQDQAFVLMQFFGNLDRDPEPWEYRERLKRLKANGDYHQLVSDFLYSTEYRKRFGYVN